MAGWQPPTRMSLVGIAGFPSRPDPVRGRMFLLQRLQEKGQLSDVDARRAQEAQSAEPSRPLHEILLEKGIGNEMHVLQTLAEEFGLELVDLSQAQIEAATLAVIPAHRPHPKGRLPRSRHNGTPE